MSDTPDLPPEYRPSRTTILVWWLVTLSTAAIGWWIAGWWLAIAIVIVLYVLQVKLVNRRLRDDYKRWKELH